MKINLDRKVVDVIFAQSLLMLIPLAATPLIIVHYRLEGLGFLALAQSIAAIIAILYELGYSLRNQTRASELLLLGHSMRCLFIETVIAKTVLLIPLILIANLFFWWDMTPYQRISYNLMTFAHFILAIMPVFYFYAAGKIRHLMIANVSARLFPVIFLILQEAFNPPEAESDIQIYMVVILLSNALNLILVLYLFLKENKKTRVVRLVDIYKSLTESWKFAKITYLSQLTIHLPIQILGQISGYEVVGQYSLAEKFVNAVKSVQSQVLFMYQRHALQFLKKDISKAPLKILQQSYSFLVLLALFFLISSLSSAFIFATGLLDYRYFAFSLPILAFTPILIQLSSLINVHVFANLDKLRPANISLTTGLMLCLSLMSLCFSIESSTFIPISVFLVEFSVLLVSFLFLMRDRYEH